MSFDLYFSLFPKKNRRHPGTQDVVLRIIKTVTRGSLSRSYARPLLFVVLLRCYIMADLLVLLLLVVFCTCVCACVVLVFKILSFCENKLLEKIDTIEKTDGKKRVGINPNPPTFPPPPCPTSPPPPPFQQRE